MSHDRGLDRRAFLRNAGITAIAAGAAPAGMPALSAVSRTSLAPPPNGKYDFDTVYNRIGTNCTKWDRQIALYGKDNIAVGMGIADLDFPVPPVITKALQERIAHENWGYLDSQRPFIETVVAWNKKRYNVDIDPDSVIMATGVHPGLIAAIATFSPPGSKVLLQTPTYNGFYSDLTFTRTIPEESPMKVVNGRYQMDFDDLDRRISHDTHTLILCNPQNPTGNCWSAEDLMTLGEICLRRRVIVLADEIHCDFVNKGEKYTPFASLPNKAIVDNSITFKAASKSFGLAAMKCAYFYSTNRELIERIRPNHRADLSTLGLIATHAAYTGGEDWLDQVRDYIDGNHEFVASFVRSNIPMIKTVKPQGTYLSWLDMSELAERINAKKLAEEANRSLKPGETPLTPEQMIERWLVKNAKVHLNQGRSYGRGGEGHMRMNIGTSRQLVKLALENIAEALSKPTLTSAL
jgi:cystathionine beta-lyase